MAGSGRKINWKAFLIVGIALVLIIVIIIIIATACGKKDDIPGNMKIAELDGQAITVYDTELEARNTPIQSENIDRVLKLKKSGAKATGSFDSFIQLPTFGIMSDNGEGAYTLNFSKMPLNATMLIEIAIGGEDSLVAKRLTGNENAEKYYVAIAIETNGGSTETESPAPEETNAPADDSMAPDNTDNASDNSDTTDNTGNTENTTTAPSAPTLVPSGKVYIGEDTYMTYASEWEAQQACADNHNTLPTFMVKDGLQLKAEPNEGTARMFLTPCLVDTEVIYYDSVRLNADSDWSGVMDVSEFAGKQVTFMIKAENSMGLNNGYTYVSFFIPEFKAESQ